MKNKEEFLQEEVLQKKSSQHKQREIGIHLRLKNSYTKLIEQAHKYDITSFQFFFMSQDSNKYIRLTKTEAENFLLLSQKFFSTIYAHSSYWINPATGDQTSRKIAISYLKKEIKIAKQLKINYLIIHPGSAKGYLPSQEDPSNKIDGIKAVANMLNKILKKEDPITLLLENTTHENKTIGSNLNDFKLLKPLLTQPQKIGFCIDTCHAFAYGYDLEKTDSFVETLDQTMGLKNIKLIHLNDSAKPQGSKIDKHAVPGKGLIGKKILQKIINHKKLKHIPIIIEPPVISNQKIQEMLNNIKEW